MLVCSVAARTTTNTLYMESNGIEGTYFVLIPMATGLPLAVLSLLFFVFFLSKIDSVQWHRAWLRARLCESFTEDRTAFMECRAAGW